MCDDGQIYRIGDDQGKWKVGTESVWNYGSHLNFSRGFWV
jgi:hypothetical protein